MQSLLGLSSSATSQRPIIPPLIQDRQPTWSRVTTRSSKKRYLHTSIVFKHYIITYGGSKENDGFDDSFGDIIVLDINTYEWKRAKTKGYPVAPRYAHTACLYNENKMVVFGGHCNTTLDDTLFFTLDEEEIYSMQVENKHYRKTTGDNARCRHTANIFGDKMYVFGGLDRNGDSTNTLWSLDLNADEWTKCKTAGNIPDERYGHSSAVHNNCLFVFGGYKTQSDEFMSDLYIMDLNAFVWDRVQTISSPSPRRGMSLVGRNDKLYMFGGCDYSGGHLNDLHVLDLNEYTWNSVVTKNNSPDGRSRHSAVYYDEGMFIWGGSGHAYHSDIYHLDLRLLEREGNGDSYQNYVSQIKDLYTTMKFSDIDFVVGTERFAAHKVILATRSPFFAKLFSHGGKEFNGTEIVIDDVSVDSFEAILEYIYSNRITIKSENAADIFQLANKWGIKKLENRCQQFLMDHLSLANYVEIANVAAKVGAEELIEAAVDFGTQHLDSLKSDKLSDLSQTILVKTIFKVKEVGSACKCRSRRRCRCKYSRFK